MTGLRRLALLGAIASTAVTVGGALATGADADLTVWAWTLPVVPVRPRIDLLPALVCFYGGLVLLTRCWLGLRRRPDVTTGAVAVIVAVWALPLLVGPPLASRDVFAYAAVGELARVGLDPYAVGPDALGHDDQIAELVDPLWRDDPTPYGPAFVWLARATVVLGGSNPMSTVYLFRGLAVAGLVLLGAALVRIARLAGRSPADAVILAVANPLTLLHLVSGAHNEALMIGLLAAGLALARSGRPRWAIAVCALAATIKLPALAGVVYVGWSAPGIGASLRRRAGSLGAAVVLTLVLLDLIGAATGYGWGWVDTLRGTEHAGVHWLSISSDVAFLAGWLGELVPLLGAAAGALLLLRSHRLDLAGLGAALLVVGLCLPNVQPWYPLWGLAVLAPALAGTRARGFEVAAVVFAFVALPGPGLAYQLAGTSAGDVAIALLVLAPLFIVRNPAMTTAISTALRTVRSTAGAVWSSWGGPQAPSTAVVSPVASPINAAGSRSPSHHARTASGSSHPRNWGETSGDVTSKPAVSVSAPSAGRGRWRRTSTTTRPKTASNPKRSTGSTEPIR